MSICAKGPVNLYLEEYRDEFAALLREFIADAIQAKGINEADNAVLAREIYLHVIKKQHLETHYFWMLFLFLLPIAAAVIWCFILVARCMADKEVSVLNWCSFALFAAFTIYIIGWQMIPRICKLEKEMEQLASLIAQKKAVALAQLRPLYDCFDWNTGTKLMEKLLPQLKFDDYLPAERLADLKKNFHFNTDLGQNRSVLYTHSGTFHGYPFCFLHNRLLTWGSKTYHGSKVIHWTERVRNSEGKYVTVYRSQILTASVTKPYPEFSGEKIFIFGHDAAPKLSFSRTPSSLSGAEKSLFNTIGRKIKFQELRDLEQNLTDDNGFTMMSNREFELLFNSTNRSDEIGYRLLFTPLAQQHMVTLLNDKKAGFGDDFYYSKKNKITTITSRHLQNFAFSTEPMVLNEYDLKVAKQRLFSRYMEFFRKVYFTLAPLFTIPLYNEARNYIPPIEEEKTISNWEMESIAHYQGDEYYKHPECITDCLLKVHRINQHGNGATAEVTAVGFRGIERTDCVLTYGEDDRWHNVYVDWIEYQQVEKTSQLTAHRADKVQRNGKDLRRSLLIKSPCSTSDFI